MSTGDTGFLIVHVGARAVEAWARRYPAASGSEYVRALRGAFPAIDPMTYAGIQRFAFSEESDAPECHEAHSLLMEALGPYDYVTAWPRSFVPSLEQAQAILRVLPSPEDYEIVSAAQYPHSCSGDRIGFDIGYWAGGDFSLIADVLVMPRWHPAPPTVFPQLFALASRLNSRVLFSQVRDAEAYLDFYRSQPWAEVDAAGEFFIICVGRP